jgi:hypothetical protein
MDFGEKQRLLLTRIEERTEKGDLKWSSDAELNSFSAALNPNYLVRTTWPGNTAYVYVIDNTGQEIFKFSEETEDPASGVSAIWGAARRNALGLDKALDELLKDLE